MKMSKKLIRFDWAMKRLLRDKANFGVLEGFLSELLRFDIKISAIEESEGNQEHEKDKFNRVDIIAKTTANQIIIIELQIDSQADYFQRMLYGTSKAITERLFKGNPYEQIKKVYSVNIVYFGLGQGTDYIYHGTTEFRGIHDNDILQITENQREKYGVQHVKDLFAEFYILKINGFNGKAKDTLDEWIYFLKNDEIEENFTAKGIKEAKIKLLEDSMSDADKSSYFRHLENMSLEASLMMTADFEGIQKGIEQGKIEQNLKLAIKMRNRGFDFMTISELTGLSIEEIEKL
jgi:predicted transposase/invertase (TIGR01784 family)